MIENNHRNNCRSFHCLFSNNQYKNSVFIVQSQCSTERTKNHLKHTSDWLSQWNCWKMYSGCPFGVATVERVLHDDLERIFTPDCSKQKIYIFYTGVGPTSRWPMGAGWGNAWWGGIRSSSLPAQCSTHWPTKLPILKEQLVLHYLTNQTETTK